jgi:hypothetical protein
VTTNATMNGAVGGASSNTVQRTTRQLYRDCLRLVRHMAPGIFQETNRKATALRTMVRSEFKKNQHITNHDEIEVYKANAIRALSNYYVLKSVQKDPKIEHAANNYHIRSVQAVSDHDKVDRNNNSTTANTTLRNNNENNK